MRAAAALAVSLIALVAGPAEAPAAPSAATPSAAAAPAHRGADVTRDQYIARATRNAERRFDRMDADHDGVLTAEERRAYRAAHHRHRRTQASPSQPQKCLTTGGKHAG